MAALHSRASKELGRVPVARLLVRYSIPAIVGMVVQALYNLVDRLYIGHCVGPDGLAGFALTFPPMMVTIAFGTLFGIGTSTRISIAMGQGKRRIAQCYLGQAVCAFLFLSLLVYPICALFIEPLLSWTGGTERSIPHAANYLRILFCCIIFQYLSFGLNNIIRTQGHPTKALLTMLFGAIANIVLDPFFIFDEVNLGFCRLPGMGLEITGAAIATVIAQAISAAWVMSFFLSKRSVLRLKLGFIKLYRPLFWSVVVIGLPPFALNLMGAAINALYNVLFKLYAPSPVVADREIAAIGIVMTVQGFICMPLLGVAQGMQPILGFNYGAKNYVRLRKALLLALWASGGFIFVTSLLIIAFRQPIFGLFCDLETAAELYHIGSAEMAIFFSGFAFVGYAIVIGQYFQSTGRGGISLIMSLSRQCLLLVPMLVLFAYFFGGVGIWWAAPISDILSVFTALGFHYWESKRLDRLQGTSHLMPNVA